MFEENDMARRMSRALVYHTFIIEDPLQHDDPEQEQQQNNNRIQWAVDMSQCCSLFGSFVVLSPVRDCVRKRNKFRFSLYSF